MSLKILLLNKRVETCTGSLVTELFVLTAAHCVYDKDKKDIKVYQGTWIRNRDSRNVVKLYIQESYNHTSEVIIGDLSVLKIDKPFSHIEEYIRIGGSPIDFANNKYLNCIVIGFGIINNEHEGFINQIMVKHGRKACEGYDSVQIIDTWQQYLCEIPSKHKTYEGDSGGPMICDGLLYGVCSFSIHFNGGDMQTIHVFIDYYRKWVFDIIEPVQSTSLTAKQKRIKKNKTNQKSDAKLIIPN
ncbi:chymase-like [Rhopalosiphum padi]|uniref:chymase-like n=1 Tax=Rhopalosiphum padi TaxID=40932 RepID=UPI00298E0B59|nr:chymase-like [Rhopalosiphum padi]